MPSTTRGPLDPPRPGGLPFSAIAPVTATVDDVTVPSGYRWDPIIRWGDPITRRAPEFDQDNQNHAAQAEQFGYNCDYLDIIVTDRRGTRALLVANHEYTNENIMFPPTMSAEEVVRTAWAAHGMSVVELRRNGAGETWEYDQRRPPQPPDHPRHDVRRRRPGRRHLAPAHRARTPQVAGCAAR